jgi:hypothetical protein
MQSVKINFRIPDPPIETNDSACSGIILRSASAVNPLRQIRAATFEMPCQIDFPL